MTPLDDTLRHILDLARWAPSGDNSQPWRFEVVGARRLVVHGFDTREHCVYDLDGHPSQMSLGALLETIALAAGTYQLALSARRRPDAADDRPTFDLAFIPAPASSADPLAESIVQRCVQRRPLRTRPLTATEKTTLAQTLPAGYRLVWHERPGQRLALALLLYHNAGLRLRMPEAYPTHRAVIEWNARTSEDRIPDQALGVDPLTRHMMRWVLHSWRRVEFCNTWLAGTVAPRVQMDLVPALACAAHFLLLAPQRPTSTDDYVAAGRAMQRFWLTATALGLQLQPQMTPLIFARYLRERRPFTASAGLRARAAELALRAERLFGRHDWEHAVFMGRIGAGGPAEARSLRRPLRQLLLDETAPEAAGPA
ncbi:nitroreductase family protein [Rugamonas sp. DEMB1]|uniref:nitroreductase family protein n=1 Tax=Rugamonas sp. DEMB1 TaxID=3039386 RepID=UPI00244D626E|nr:nitroreductase family protein [Rugamonas sp. DEMB1]WGG48969.1 nitroreductase family protein [Rugamonas sp. DEMB1]